MEISSIQMLPAKTYLFGIDKNTFEVIWQLAGTCSRNIMGGATPVYSEKNHT